MCFSATASFTAAAVTGAAGIACVLRVPESRDMPLAAVPVFFAVQQAIEGFLWLTLPVAPEGARASLLTDGFLIFALVFWPAFSPFVSWLIEPDRRRARLILLPLAVGWSVAAYLFWSLATGVHGASIVGGHIVYDNNPGAPAAVGLLYLAATAGGPALSSLRAVQLLAAIVLLGSLVAYFVYYEAFVSVWCFFAAAASAVIVTHFERVRAARAAAHAGG